MHRLTVAARFVPRICDQTKVTTIRRESTLKRGDEVAIDAWNGVPYRKGSTRGMIAVVTVVFVVPIKIDCLGFELNGVVMAKAARESLAAFEGFANRQELKQWIADHYRLPFNGVLIRWAYY